MSPKTSPPKRSPPGSPPSTRADHLEREAQKNHQARAPRWKANKEQVKHLDAACERTEQNRQTKEPVKGDKTTDCIYFIEIGGNTSYVGQTNNQKRTTKRHKQMMKGMELRNPGEAVTIRFFPGIAQLVYFPQFPGIAGLNAMEANFMNANDTLVKGDDPPGTGENKFRYNEIRAPEKVNGDWTPREVTEQYDFLYTCDGSTEQGCDGNAVWSKSASKP